MDSPCYGVWICQRKGLNHCIDGSTAIELKLSHTKTIKLNKSIFVFKNTNRLNVGLMYLNYEVTSLKKMMLQRFL